MHLEERLKNMVNKTWMYNTRLHKFLSYKITNDSVTIVTDRDWYQIAIAKINKELEQFLEVNEKNNLSVILFSGNGKSSIKDILYENINKLGKGELDIKTAKEINEQIKTLLSMAKLKIEMDKLEKS